MGIWSLHAEPSTTDSYMTILGILAAFLSWLILYGVLFILIPCKPHEWYSRVVAILHAFAAVILSGWSAFVQGPWPFTHPGGSLTSMHHFTCVVSLGYFIYDVMWCLYFQTEGLLMLFHHFLSIFGQALVLFRGRYGPEIIGVLFGSEISNPLLQARWFLRFHGYKDRFISVLNDFAFIFTFGFWRIGIGSYLLYCVLTHPRPDWISKGGGILVYIVSWLFWIQIVGFALRKYTSSLKNVVVDCFYPRTAITCPTVNGIQGTVDYDQIHNNQNGHDHVKSD